MRATTLAQTGVLCLPGLTLLVQEGGYALEAIGGCAVAALAGFQAGMSGMS